MNTISESVAAWVDGMGLDPDRVRKWWRADGSESLTYIMCVDDLVTDPHELRTVIDAGIGITIYSGSAPKSATSLSFLAPVIADVSDIWIGTVNRISDVDVLNGARSLRSLTFATGPCDGRLELAEMPHLEQFQGAVTRVVSSVLKSTTLRFLEVEGPIPKTFARIAGPVEVFEQYGGRSQVDLPVFDQPELMRKLIRIGPARFDFRQLLGLTGLTHLEVSVCNELIGLSELSRLVALERITLKGVATRERWEDLPTVPWGFLDDISPVPSEAFLTERRRLNWLVPVIPRYPEPTIFVDETGDDESWGVFMSRVDDLAEAVDLLDGSVAHGIHGEHFLLGVVAELREQGLDLSPQPDSEGGFTAVYFPTKEQAESVFARAKEILHGEALVQLNYLRAGRD